MRITFAKTLAEIASRDQRVVLLTGDLGFMALEPFSERFPDRFFNMGVAEQNMIGVATGLAKEGMLPFVYSIVTFATLRPFEFIRNGPVFHHLPVRIVGVGGGFEYGPAGPTHHGLEDVALMRTQPGLNIIVPADAMQTRSALEATWDLPGPVYYRLGKNEKVQVERLDGRFEIGRLQTVANGEDILIVTMGSISMAVTEAAALLRQQGVNATVVIASTINPPPVEEFRNLFPKYKLVLSVENHSVNGGLGSLLAEVMSEMGGAPKLLRCGVRNPPSSSTGSEAFYHSQQGLMPSQIADAARRALKG